MNGEMKPPQTPTVDTESEPLSPEVTAGSSYIPQDQAQASAPPMPAPQFQPIADPASLYGRATQGNTDIMLPLSGITDGDPVGMETFDLGFFEDGTPAIVINGASIPIEHAQWMSILTMRNKTRAEIKAQMEFENLRQKTKASIGRILAAAPNVPKPLAESMMAAADIDPQFALNEVNQLLVSMSKDNGQEQFSRISAILQDNAVETTLKMLRSTTEREVGKNAFGEPVFAKTSMIDTEVGKINANPKKTPLERSAAYAMMTIESQMADPRLKLAEGGANIGVFDIIQREGADTSALSRFDMLQALAANGGNLWQGMSVPFEDIPLVPESVLSANPTDPIKGLVGTPQFKTYRDYIRKLDSWANKALKWDMSKSESIDALALQQLLAKSRNTQAQSSVPVQPQTAAPAASGSDFGFGAR